MPYVITTGKGGWDKIDLRSMSNHHYNPTQQVAATAANRMLGGEGLHVHLKVNWSVHGLFRT